MKTLQTFFLSAIIWVPVGMIVAWCIYFFLDDMRRRQRMPMPLSERKEERQK